MSDIVTTILFVAVVAGLIVAICGRPRPRRRGGYRSGDTGSGSSAWYLGGDSGSSDGGGDCGGGE